MPTVSCFLSTTGHPIDKNHSLWSCRLPENRQPASKTPKRTDADAVTYGIYFSAIFNFCAADRWRRITAAASRELDQPVVEADLEHLSIFLEKHGAFYHPARLQLAVRDQTLSFVVNVAASDQGRHALAREVKALAHLNEQRPFGWFPRVYGLVSDGLPMYLGDWFDGFHEFHLTRRSENDELAIAVWDGAADRCLLSAKQAGDVYRNAAMILAACYNPVTSDQIFPWHHAAGDFVVRVEGEGAAVKLITVRDYIPMIRTPAEPDSEREILDALVVFFIHLSVRMRLDRRDGVKEVVWAPDGCLEFMMDGFFQGLDLTTRMCGFPETFPESFRCYINNHDAATLLSTAHRVTETVFDRHSEERHVIVKHLTPHMHMIRRILQV